MSVILEQAGNQGLLAYAITKHPDPLQVSPQGGDDTMASLTLVVSNNSLAPIWCSKIRVTFPVGSIAQDFTAHPERAVTSAQPGDEWQIVNNNDGSFTLTPKKPEFQLITTKGLLFTIAQIPVNTEPGVFTLTIVETSAIKKEGPFSDKTNEYELAKFPYGFFFRNLTANHASIRNGESVMLTWEGSDNAKYTMLYGKHSVIIPKTHLWDSPALTETTTFILQASLQTTTGTLNAYQSITVTVSDPDLKTKTLTTEDKAEIGGKLSVKGDAEFQNVLVNGKLSARGASEFAGGKFSGDLGANNLDVAGKFSARGAAEFAGAANVNDLTVQGKLSAKKDAEFAQAKFSKVKSDSAETGNLASGDITSSGTFVAKGSMQTIGLPGSIQPGTYTADCDLMITANVSSNASPGEKCYGSVSIKTGGWQYNATGGNVNGPWGTGYNSSGAVSVFVRKGDKYELILEKIHGTPAYAFYVWRIGRFDQKSALKSRPGMKYKAHPANVPLPDTDKMAAELLDCIERGNKKKLSKLLKDILQGK